MSLDCQRNGPPALAAAVEPDPLRVHARPGAEVAERSGGIVGVDPKRFVGWELARVATGRRADSALVVREHRQAEAGVDPDPDVVEIAFALLRAVDDHDARMRATPDRFGDRAGEHGVAGGDGDGGLLGLAPLRQRRFAMRGDGPRRPVAYEVGGLGPGGLAL